MKLGPGLVDGRFITRLNRFAALVDVGGEEVMAHVANSGRMQEMFVPGYPVRLKPVGGDHRKTKYDLALVQMGGSLASADARLPNSLVAEALEEGALSQFRGYPTVRREVTFGESRLDLMLEGEAGLCYIETKSVTLVVDGAGLFPDAPTTRGAKHMRSLAQVVASGTERPSCSSSSAAMLKPSPFMTRQTRSLPACSGIPDPRVWKHLPINAR